MRVLLIVPPNEGLEESAALGIGAAPGVGPDATTFIDPQNVKKLPGFQIDEGFPAVATERTTAQGCFEVALGVKSATEASQDAERIGTGFVIRGHLDPESLDAATAESMLPNGAQGLYSDRDIASMPTCGSDPALGTAADLARRLGVGMLHAQDYDGRTAAVAIVDSRINLNHLRSRGQSPRLDPHLSWTPNSSLVPGNLPVDHGTMTAYNVGLVAPEATLLDHAVLLSRRSGGSVMDGILSDAVRSYSVLLTIMSLPESERRYSSLIVSNSWGMFHESWDFPPGHPGRYADQPNHPFNQIVGSLAGSGADILFAAGNCGVICPDGRCQGTTVNTIMGANSHPEVMCIANVSDCDVTRCSRKHWLNHQGRLYSHRKYRESCIPSCRQGGAGTDTHHREDLGYRSRDRRRDRVRASGA